jgi:hypothetical protein
MAVQHPRREKEYWQLNAGDYNDDDVWTMERTCDSGCADADVRNTTSCCGRRHLAIKDDGTGWHDPTKYSIYRANYVD